MQLGELLILLQPQAVVFLAELNITVSQLLVRGFEPLNIGAFDPTRFPNASVNAQQTRALGGQLGVVPFQPLQNFQSGLEWVFDRIAILAPGGLRGRVSVCAIPVT
ncbi:hypothetical protein [Streptomyces sp. NPDC021139]|uniref:hypothetical protein n=1 Tax=Streptomyces sp. NPDC021139 TaxID=3154899 RepID=UPI0033FE1DBF